MDKKPFPSETQERFIVRFPDGMRDRIADIAKANGRSMNAEIVARLQQSFEPPSDTAHHKEVADAHRSTATVLGLLSTTLANILLTALRLFTPEQRKKFVQIGVWEAIAEGVVNGRGTAIAEMLENMKSGGVPGSVNNPTGKNGPDVLPKAP